LTRQDRRYRTEAFVRLKAGYLVRGPLEGIGRPVVIWGAGRVGRLLGRALEAEGVTAAAFIDIDPRKIGRTRRGRPVWAPEALAVEPGLARAVILAAVPVVEARLAIRHHLGQGGRVEGRDFWLCA
jgi:FlaA1/EpsC-like NDP-sugar epimerase